ncbi:uncharacterized protein JN550_009856 [Neoarthrinium moseri]|uniref:uncharacterized protein n=1 Tax=Neoarthrinium moseri TaxID=1658444 RepID=UPI001FDBD0F3|nr:uncharacterized protein JN550_009856 [Neoarthrinium moseri]KAI1863120.1 hypothetical protein JN550_009856 [Neoarthrinium moseri]
MASNMMPYTGLVPSLERIRAEHNDDSTFVIYFSQRLRVLANRCGRQRHLGKAIPRPVLEKTLFCEMFEICKRERHPLHSELARTTQWCDPYDGFDGLEERLLAAMREAPHGLTRALKLAEGLLVDEIPGKTQISKTEPPMTKAVGLRNSERDLNDDGPPGLGPPSGLPVESSSAGNATKRRKREHSDPNLGENHAADAGEEADIVMKWQDCCRVLTTIPKSFTPVANTLETPSVDHQMFLQALAAGLDGPENVTSFLNDEACDDSWICLTTLCGSNDYFKVNKADGKCLICNAAGRGKCVQVVKRQTGAKYRVVGFV